MRSYDTPLDTEFEDMWTYTDVASAVNVERDQRQMAEEWKQYEKDVLMR